MESSATQAGRAPVPAHGAASMSGASKEPMEPHEALFLVMGYLQLPELFSVHRVCRSFRDAVAGDRLLWRNVAVEPPLSGRLTDGALLEVTSRAAGTLRTLALVNCWRVTDAGLQRVVDENPGITELHVPGCSHLTADGLVRVVRSIAEHEGNLRQVQLHGVPNITKEHLDILKSLLSRHPQQDQEPFFYGDCCSANSNKSRPIDIDICPKCNSARLVFDCTRQTCRLINGHLTECRGCFFCIPRCGDCGGCFGLQELGEESACRHLLCLKCWLRLPKCNMCNRPYCPGHGSSSSAGCPRSSGFICQECQSFEASLSAWESGACVCYQTWNI